MSTTTTEPTVSTSPQQARPDQDKDRWEVHSATDRDKDRWEANETDRDKDRWEANETDRDKDRWEANASGGVQRTLQPAAVGRWLVALGTMVAGLGVLLLTRTTCCQELSDTETLDGALPAL